MVPVVTYVGYLSYQNGQRSVEDLTAQLMDSTISRWLVKPIIANTPAAGATVVGQRIQAALQARHLPHQASAVGTRVTLSLGIATLIPGAL